MRLASSKAGGLDSGVGRGAGAKGLSQITQIPQIIRKEVDFTSTSSLKP